MELEEEEKLDLEEKQFKLNINDTSNIENLNIAYIPKIKNLLEFIITQNNINKKYKFSLFKIRGFDPNTIFNEIDTISSGFINSKDLEEYLTNNNIKIEPEILNLFIRQFNKEGKHKNLYKKDFIDFINFGAPISEKTSYELNDYNKEEINKIFLNLITSEFELIKNQKKLINEIIQIKEFSTFEAFNIISFNKSYIDLNMLKQFLGNKFQDNEIKELIHRIDLNNDKKISYEEFQDLFFPFQSHLHLDSEEEKEIDNFIQNKYYINSTLYENYILSSPNIIDKKDNILNEEEIKININKNTNNKIKDTNNEIDFEEKKNIMMKIC
jgi:Ca2+-binding EF-hand superfamily protein